MPNILSVLNESLFLLAIILYMWFQKTSRVDEQTAYIFGMIATSVLFMMVCVNLAMIVPIQINVIVKSCLKRTKRKVEPIHVSE